MNRPAGLLRNLYSTSKGNGVMPLWTAATSFTDCALASVFLHKFPHTFYQFPLFYSVHSFDFLISYRGTLSCRGGPATASDSCRKRSGRTVFGGGHLSA